MSDQLSVALVSVIGSVIVTYLTVKYKNTITRKIRNEPKDRMDTIFDGYEKLIKQQQDDIQFKQLNIASLQIIIDKQREQIEESQHMIDTLKQELENARTRNLDLQDQLSHMKEDYKHGDVK